MLTTPGFSSPLDIGNRALHHCGADHELITIQDQTKPARLIRNVYNKLRQAELRRNSWTFAIRHTILWPVATTSIVWTPPAYSALTTYSVGQVVQYDDGMGSRLWIAVQAGLLNVAPGTTSGWSDYFGSLIAQLWVAPSPGITGTTYYPGDIVYTGTYNVYLATIQTVNQPGVSSDWVLVGTVATPLQIMYPIATGPTAQTTTLNVFPVPYGYLRKLKQDPTAGGRSFLGTPTNAVASDWVVENGYIISHDFGPLLLRFVADVSNVAKMDAMFCEGFAARIAGEIAEPLTQSTEKLKAISGVYQKSITEARLVNSIEDGADAPELDDFIACRV